MTTFRVLRRGHLLALVLLMLGRALVAQAPDAAPAAPAPDAAAAGIPASAVVPEVAPKPRPAPANVTAGDQVVFPVTANLGPFAPSDRAAALTHKLQMFIADKEEAPDDIKAVENENGTDIVGDDDVLMRVTDQDADFDDIGRSRQALAADHVARLRAAVTRVRDENSGKSLTLGAIKAAAATAVLLLLFLMMHFVFPRVYAAIEDRGGSRIRPLRFQSLEIMSRERITGLLLQLARVCRFALTIVLLYFFIPLVFSFFAATRQFGYELVHYVMEPIAAGWQGFLHYLPRLLVVVIIAFFAFQAQKLTRFLFREIERGTIVWPGFYPEWAMPTYRIVEILLFAFALVVAFPYLPGSDSAAFRGVSIFLGVLLSLGSSSAIANVVAGVLLTYTRAFRIGDRVQIDNTVGDIIEKTLLATHVRTIKNVDITIPNGLVLGAHIVNYSRSTAAEPLILNMELTLGYDIAWPTVHKLLLTAVDATPGLLKEPKPFVLQTALDDFYVRYQVNAHTAQPSEMALIYSDLNRNILDGFNEAGVEIMSPHYRVVRGNDVTTIPDGYLRANEPADPARHPHVQG
jgi:small-conductance mechanosensitive channel